MNEHAPAPSDDPILDIRDLSIVFRTRERRVPAVSGFNCRIMPGETMGLVGESGCGKSTVALGIMGDLGRHGHVAGGRILFRGEDLAAMSEGALNRIRGRQIAMIYQEPTAALNPALTIGAQLTEVPRIHQHASRKEARARAIDIIHDVGLADPRRILAAYPHQLSGGQQQRIVIAMALIAHPALLILDEPTTALDVTVEAAIVALIRRLARKYETAMLFISHDLGLIREVCDRLTIMYSGEAVETGTAARVFAAMRHPYTQALFRAIPSPVAPRGAALHPIAGNAPEPGHRPTGCNFAPRCRHFRAGVCDVAPIPMAAVDDAASPHETRCIRWQEIDWDAPAPALPPRVSTASPRVILTADDLRKYYAAAPRAFGGKAGRVVRANETLTFAIHAGETLALVGESGCGKSTLAKVLLGIEQATSGRLSLLGRRVEKLPVERRPQDLVAALQMVFQNPIGTLNPSIGVGRQIMRALEVLGAGGDGAARRARMFELLDLVRLPREIAALRPDQLSGGQKQRVAIARAFAGKADLVVADEPVSALDVSVQAAIIDLLIALQRENGTALLFISHDLSILRYFADRIMVMYLGHVMEIGTVDDIFAPPYHPYTEALLSAIPVADPRVHKTRIVLDGEIPSATDPPPGCPFQTRCRWKHLVPDNLCDRVMPPVRDLGHGHQIKCHLADDILAGMKPVMTMDGVTTGDDSLGTHGNA